MDNIKRMEFRELGYEFRFKLKYSYFFVIHIELVRYDWLAQLHLKLYTVIEAD
jgi:hypothetical protein